MRSSSRFVLGMLLCLVLATPARAQATTWSCHGPYGGRVLALAISPAYALDHTIYAGAETGGLFRTTGGGVAWQNLTGLPADVAISSIVVSPNYAKDHTVLVSTSASGVWKSRDGGDTWTSWSDGLTTLNVIQMAASPDYAADQTLLAATNRGVFLSETAGKLWLPVGPSITTLSVAISHRDSGEFTAYAGTVAGLYVSEDSGHTWEATPFDSLPVVSIALSLRFHQDHTLLLGTLGGAYLSNDGGSSWNGPWLEEQAVNCALFSPNYVNGHTLFLGTDEGVYISQNHGNSWALAEQSQDTVYAIVASPDYTTAPILYAATDHNGVWASEDGGATWVSRNEGIASLPLNAVAASPNYTRDCTLLAGGSSGIWISNDDALTWQAASLVHASVNKLCYSPTYVTDYTAYAATDAGVFVSRDRGLTWNPASEGLDILDVTDLTMSRSGEIWVSTSGGGVYYAAANDLSWQPRNEGLSSAYITAIEWLGQEGEKSYLAAGTWGAGVFISDNGGLVWRAAVSGPDTPHIRDLANATGYGGANVSFAATTAGAFLSLNRGDEWSFKGLLGLDIAAISLHPAYASRPNCYVGSVRDGVFRSIDGGLRWYPLNDGLGDLQINDLSIATSDANPIVLAATQGGVWRYGGSPLTPQPEPTPARLLALPLVFQ